jgi:oligopeptide transport system substrate-binding protein
MRITRIAAIAGGLTIASALALSGCAGPDENGGGGGDSDAIITVRSNEPQNPLIPTNTNEVGGGLALQNLFAGLIFYDADGSPVNDVAESIESDDAQTYTITIREGLEFTNGEPVTAESFVDAWDYGALLSNAQLNSYFFDNIVGFSYDEDSHIKGQGLNVVDDTTFTVELTQPEADWPLRLGYTAFMPLPAVAFEDIEAFGEEPIGNGPYMLDEWRHDDRIKLVANPDYDGPRVPKNGGVDLVAYTSFDAAYADLLADNLDVIDQIPENSLPVFEDDLGDRAYNQPAAIFQSFTIPGRLPHFAGEEGQLRRAAISHAINREEITDVIFDGTRTPAHDFTSPVIDGYSEDVPGAEVLEYDPDLAVDLWAQADAISPWDGQFGIAYNSDGPHQGWVDAVANSLKNVLGIDAVGVPYPDLKGLRTDIVGDTIQTAFRTGWQADYPSLFNFLGPLYGTGAGANDGDYSNPEVDDLLAQGAAAGSVDDANAIFQQVQTILFTDLPAIPLWYQSLQGGRSTLVDNVEFGWDSWPIVYEITKSE